MKRDKEYERLKANEEEFQKYQELQKSVKGAKLAQKRGNYEII